jgi:hypothetical protein
MEIRTERVSDYDEVFPVEQFRIIFCIIVGVKI